jgi:ParB-like chromosome segregation protein Spo0J
MARRPATSMVKMAFEEAELRLAIAHIQPLKLVSSAIKRTPKYVQIAASIREVGIVEPPVVARDHSEPGKYLLLDGHLRIDVLKDMGETDVTCLVSTDDEAFTYNKRVNRIAIIQEHRMILKAVERGVPEERIAKALNVDVCQSASKFDPPSASNFDPLERRVRAVALALSELVGIAETA